jgi:hypothetical protein
MVQMKSKPLSVMGNGLMKSIPIDSQGQVGICKECKSPLGFCVESFATWHCPQDLQNLSMSLDIVGRALCSTLLSGGLLCHW